MEVHIKRDYSVPAAIQFKNPGAMWPGAVATKWGSTKWQYLSDGTGQGGAGHGNKIAIFDTWVDGISAQLDLWRSSANYKNKRFADAINIWDGHNNTPSYIKLLKAKVPGLTENTIMNDAFWRGSMAIPFLKAQSSHEAGKTIPAPEADWIAAQKRVMGGTPVLTPKKAVAATIVVSAVEATRQATAAPTFHFWALDVPHVLMYVLALGGLLWGAYEVHKWLKNYSTTSLASVQSSPSVGPSSLEPSGVTGPSTSTTIQSPSVPAPTATATKEPDHVEETVVLAEGPSVPTGADALSGGLAVQQHPSVDVQPLPDTVPLEKQ